MTNTLSGSCLCGAVKFELTDDFHQFYQCHCRQCQQFTGSAFATNLFTAPDNIKWIDGKEHITHYDHPTRVFSKSFCSKCGAALPFITQSREALLVPAGSLNQRPKSTVQANIFVDEQAFWLDDGKTAKAFRGFPE